MSKEVKDANKKDVKFDSNGNDFVVTDNSINFTYRRPLSIPFSDINNFVANFNAFTRARREFMSRINSKWFFIPADGMALLASSSDFCSEELAKYLKGLEGDRDEEKTKENKE